MTPSIRHFLTAALYALVAVALACQLDVDGEPLINGFLTLRLLTYAACLTSFYHLIRANDHFSSATVTHS